MQSRLEKNLDAMILRKQMVEHPFGQAMDENYTLVDENAETCQHRDEFSCVGLKYETRDDYYGCDGVNEGDASIGLVFACKKSRN